ncbi:hypothetical protein GCK72_022500 [Caenorhabditis remanei]|uniref:Uncharacterized protein n=1 Tax=Caenorhabditis remanei TaxID=31234 RepID=A0A6A5FU92_CAERE|nr:hypothetical protein GCK72_022500 [Caenorhabditis remanei]KAF1746049.1 hypothetical protein GCK72_022500 [Caenorhabditis remanei]
MVVETTVFRALDTETNGRRSVKLQCERVFQDYRDSRTLPEETDFQKLIDYKYQQDQNILLSQEPQHCHDHQNNQKSMIHCRIQA